MKKTYMQPEVAMENMELEEMIAASVDGITLDASDDVESISGGDDFLDGTILSRTPFDFFGKFN